MWPFPGDSCSVELSRTDIISPSYLLTYSVPLVRKRTIPIERPPLVGEVSANFCGYGVPRGQRDGSLLPYSRLCRPITSPLHNESEIQFSRNVTTSKWTRDSVRTCLQSGTDICMFACLFVHICLYSFHKCFVRFVAYPNHILIQIIVKTK
jgi:hypothetical protein